MPLNDEAIAAAATTTNASCTDHRASSRGRERPHGRRGVFTDATMLPMLEGIAQAAAAAGAVTGPQSRAWIAEQQQRARNGRLFVALPMFLAAAPPVDAGCVITVPLQQPMRGGPRRGYAAERGSGCRRVMA